MQCLQGVSKREKNQPKSIVGPDFGDAWITKAAPTLKTTQCSPGKASVLGEKSEGETEPRYLPYNKPHMLVYQCLLSSWRAGSDHLQLL